MSTTVNQAASAVALPGARLRRRGPGVLMTCAFAFVALTVACAAFAPLIAPHDPGAQDLMNSLAAPSGAHPLGTNDLGQDILSRLIYGARTALVGPAVVAVVSTALASGLGLLAGYHGGRVDTVVMRWVDLMMSIPSLLVAVVVVGVLGGGYPLAVALLSVLAAPSTVRLIRAATMEQRPRPYVEAAESLGLPARTIIRRHVWPNVMPVAIASGFLVFAFSLVLLSSLAFLGLGVSLDSPDWGRMLASSKQLIFQTPVAVIAPGVAIVLLASSMSLIGDWSYERASARGTGR